MSSTGSVLLSEQENDTLWAWSSGGPWTNKNEHPDWSENVAIIVLIKATLVTLMILLCK